MKLYTILKIIIIVKLQETAVVETQLKAKLFL